MLAPLSLLPTGNWLGNDGSWSTFYVEVGTPPQIFQVLPAFSSNYIMVPIADECERLQRGSITCGSSRGVFPFAQKPSSGFQSNSSSSWETIGLYQIGLERNHGIVGNGLNGFDRVTLRNFTLDRLPITAYTAPGFWLGHIGLFPVPLNFSETVSGPSLLQALKQKGHIPSLSFGYSAGAPYREVKIEGSLVLGGYDRSRAASPLTIKMSTDVSRVLTVGVQNILVTNTFNGTLSLIGTEQVLAPIDSTMPEIWLPRSVCDRFESVFGLQYHEVSGRYALSDATRDKLRSMKPTLTFTIGTSTISGGNTTIIHLPYAAFDLQASYPIFANTTNYFPIRRADNESQYAIGRVFLQEAYISVDYESETFNISAARWDNTTADIVAIPSYNDTLVEPKHGDTARALSRGMIAGIVVGTLAALVLLVGSWVGCYHRKSKKIGETKCPLPGQNVVEPNGTELLDNQVHHLDGKGIVTELRGQKLVAELEAEERVCEIG